MTKNPKGTELTTWERILAIAGGVASIIALVDSLFLKSQLASALSVPPTMPTGITAITVLLGSVCVLLALRRISSMDRRLGETEAEKRILLEERSAALIEVEKLKQELKLSDAKGKLSSDLQDKVFAVLVRKQASPYQIIQELELDRSHLPDVIGAIASLVKSGKIEGGSLSTDYRIKGR